MRDSPFPGMDPYVELRWFEAHPKLIVYMAEVLNTVLPDDLAATIEQRLGIGARDEDDGEVDDDRRADDAEDDDESIVQPDVHVSPVPGTTASAALAEMPVTVEAPHQLVASVEPRPRRLSIVEFPGNRRITVIELVSPSNKRGRGLDDFRSKRDDLLDSGVNFVEIDLVRNGSWRALMQPHVCPRRLVTPYRITVRLPTDPDRLFLHPIRLRDRLPTFAVPLRRTDPPVRLDLDWAMDRVFASGRYGRQLQYDVPLVPRLTGDDALFAAEMLAAHRERQGLRPAAPASDNAS